MKPIEPPELDTTKQVEATKPIEPPEQLTPYLFRQKGRQKTREKISAIAEDLLETQRLMHLKQVRKAIIERQKNETEEQRSRRLEQNRNRYRLKNETEEQRSARLERVLVNTSELRANETEEQRSMRLERVRVNASERRANETEQQRSMRLERARVNVSERRANETVRLKQRENYRRKLLNETAEERLERVERRRKVRRRCYWRKIMFETEEQRCAGVECRRISRLKRRVTETEEKSLSLQQVGKRNRNQLENLRAEEPWQRALPLREEDQNVDEESYRESCVPFLKFLLHEKEEEIDSSSPKVVLHEEFITGSHSPDQNQRIQKDPLKEEQQQDDKENPWESGELFLKCMPHEGDEESPEGTFTFEVENSTLKVLLHEEFITGSHSLDRNQQIQNDPLKEEDSMEAEPTDHIKPPEEIMPPDQIKSPEEMQPILQSASVEESQKPQPDSSKKRGRKRKAFGKAWNQKMLKNLRDWGQKRKQVESVKSTNPLQQDRPAASSKKEAMKPVEPSERWTTGRLRQNRKQIVQELKNKEKEERLKRKSYSQRPPNETKERIRNGLETEEERSARLELRVADPQQQPFLQREDDQKADKGLPWESDESFLEFLLHEEDGESSVGPFTVEIEADNSAKKFIHEELSSRNHRTENKTNFDVVTNLLHSICRNQHSCLPQQFNRLQLFDNICTSRTSNYILSTVIRQKLNSSIVNNFKVK